jgi:hypothetical protein
MEVMDFYIAGVDLDSHAVTIQLKTILNISDSNICYTTLALCSNEASNGSEPQHTSAEAAADTPQYSTDVTIVEKAGRRIYKSLQGTEHG